MFRSAATDPYGAAPDPASASGDGAPPPQKPKRSRWRTFKRGLLIFVILFVVVVAWLAVTAPLSKSLEPINAPSLTILSADGEVIARRGAIIEEPVDVTQLPDHVWQPFVAIEDRNFHSHFGVSLRGTVRALLRNLGAGRVRQGGSTITQQLAKTSFLSSERTIGRKVQEALIAFWLEAWLSKDEILSRYLSNVYFGDNVYGLRAAARHYFSREPENLTVAQAAMLAAIVNAPSRLAPTRNLRAAQERSRVVMREMIEANMLSEGEYDSIRPARLNVARRREVPTGTYFADWVIQQAERLSADGEYGERVLHTTLDGELQRLAVRAVRSAGLGRAQVALVAMRPDGRVVAMVGGKNYSDSPFNRATQARRQPGSAFKLFVYLAAFRAGLTPTSTIDDAPVVMGRWRPQNYEGRYRGRITLRDAVAYSSNSAAIQITERVGRRNVIQAARDLGVTTPLRPVPTQPLGTENVSLIEMTAAYAAVAAGYYPVRPIGIAPEEGWLGGWWGSGQSIRRDPAFAMLRDVLYGVTQRGTGTAARIPGLLTFGKTGTTSDYRDAWFFGFAQDLVVGVWVGRDDNSPMPGVSGGGAPARIWRAFMSSALSNSVRARPDPVPLIQADRDPAPVEPANDAAPANPAPDTDPPTPPSPGTGDTGVQPLPTSQEPARPPVAPPRERPGATTPPETPRQREQPPQDTARPRDGG